MKYLLSTIIQNICLTYLMLSSLFAGVNALLPHSTLPRAQLIDLASNALSAAAITLDGDNIVTELTLNHPQDASRIKNADWVRTGP